MINWHEHIDRITPQIVQIRTPKGWGTGFLHYATEGGTRCIATARHVVEEALAKDQPIRIHHGGAVYCFGPQGDEMVFVQRTDADLDSAVLAVIVPELPRPSVPLIAPAERCHVNVGTEVGWLGFPDLDTLRHRLCFFSGRVSLIDPDAHRYLIDGNNVRGCSGGPVFCATPDGLRIIGALTDYFPYRDGNGAPEHERNAPDSLPNGFLPGLTAAVDISNYKSLEDALAKLRRKRRHLTLKLDKCPRCEADLIEQPVLDGVTEVVCAAGCGPVIDSIDRGIVRGFPGGRPALAEAVLHGFRSLQEAATR